MAEDQEYRIRFTAPGDEEPREPEPPSGADIVTDIAQGLSQEQARKALERHGPNLLYRADPPNFQRCLLERAGLPTFLLPLFAGILGLLSRQPEVFFFGLLAALGNLLGGAWRSLEEHRYLESRRQLNGLKCRVRRGGVEWEIPAREVVPGDVLVLGVGDLVPADARIEKDLGLSVDESVLTGQIEPATKMRSTAGNSRVGTLFRGTTILAGKAEAVVMATGLETEISRRLAPPRPSSRPGIERRFGRTGWLLLWVALGAAILTGVGGWIHGEGFGRETIRVFSAVALAASPLGLVLISWFGLVRDKRKKGSHEPVIASDHVIGRLASVTTVLSGPAPTEETSPPELLELTMIGRRIAPRSEPDGSERFYVADRVVKIEEDPLLELALGVGLLANRSHIVPLAGRRGEFEIHGDPVEGALQVACIRTGLTREKALQRFKEKDTRALPGSSHTFAVLLEAGEDVLLVAVKGSPEEVIPRCTHSIRDGAPEELDPETRETLLANVAEARERNLIPCVLAWKQTSSPEEDPFSNLLFLAVAVAGSPLPSLRAELREGLEACSRSGVRMIPSFDLPAGIVAKLASRMGLSGVEPAPVLTDASLEEMEPESLCEWCLELAAFSRLSPYGRLRVTEAMNAEDECLALVGESSSDLFAMQRAEVGLALEGIGGGEVRSVADVVFSGSEIKQVCAEIQRDRRKVENLSMACAYLLSMGLSVLVVLAAFSLLSGTAAIAPLQVFLLTVLLVCLPAVGLARDRGRKEGPLNAPPGWFKDSALLSEHRSLLVFSAGIAAGAALLAFGVCRLFRLEGGISEIAAFWALALVGLFNSATFSGLRFLKGAQYCKGHGGILLGIAVGLVFLILAAVVPFLSRLFEWGFPGIAGTLIVLVFSVLGIAGTRLIPPVRAYRKDRW